MKKFIASLIIGGSVCLFATVPSCKSKKETTRTSACSGVSTSYTADVKPVLDANCASSCHSAKKRANGIDLSTYESVKSVANEKSFLGSIRHESGYAAMPKNHPKLDDASIQKIACWVENGMQQ